MKYAVIASTFTGNLGAASMLEAAIETIGQKDPNAHFFVYTVYPRQDQAANTHKNVTVINAKPLVLALIINPLALLYRLLPPLRSLLRRTSLLGPLVAADVLLDQGGVTFVQGRTPFLIYNIATILPALLVGTPVIKCSQALGPFEQTPNKQLARLFLPRVRTIFARGARTKQYLDTLSLTNVKEAADYAFLLGLEAEDAQFVDDLFTLRSIGPNKVVCIVPSKVVQRKVEAAGKDYVQIQRQYIKKLLKDGCQVILLPHSTRFNTDKTHNNDLPVSRLIAAHIVHKKFHFIDEPLTARQVRGVIARSTVLVTSRFHGMVSGLATSVPTLVVGWSHKYQEVMDQFGLVGHALDTRDLTISKLTHAFEALYNERVSVQQRIKSRLPGVIKAAKLQVATIVQIAKSGQK